MVLPLIPALAGIAGGALASNALTKKGATDSHNVTTTDSRSYAIQYPTYQVQIDSPMASQTTKKEASATSKPSVDGGNGMDFSQLIPVALIIGGAVVVKEVIK